MQMKKSQLVSLLIFLNACFAFEVCNEWKGREGVPNSHNERCKKDATEHLKAKDCADERRLPFVHESFNFSTNNYQPAYERNDRNLIIDGGSATKHEYPWYVQVVVTGKKKSNGDEGNFYCGGTIIGKYTVLTAAHCLNITASGYNVQPKKVELIYGGSAKAQYGVHRIHSYASHYHIHPDYLNASTYPSSGSFENDIAMIHFAEGFPCNDKNIRSIGVLSPDVRGGVAVKGKNYENKRRLGAAMSASGACKRSFTADFDDAHYPNVLSKRINCTGFTIGMGLDSKVKAKQKLTSRLMEFTSTVYDCADCQGNFGSKSEKLNPRTTNVCTSTGKVASTWKGDSGGPMMIDTDLSTDKQRYVQAGLVSYGIKSSVVTVYTSVASYTKWIEGFPENKSVKFVKVDKCDTKAYAVGGGVGDQDSYFQFVEVLENWRTWVICIVFTFVVLLALILLKFLSNSLCPDCCKREENAPAYF